MSPSSISSSVCGMLVYKALYLPRCLPEGDVVVFSLHDRILPSNSFAVISDGRRSRSVAALQESSSDWHCGMELIVSI